MPTPYQNWSGGVWGRNPATDRRPKGPKHVVEDIYFEPRGAQRAAPVVCVCGVRTTVEFWREHVADPTRTDLPDPGPIVREQDRVRIKGSAPYIEPRRRSRRPAA